MCSIVYCGYIFYSKQLIDSDKRELLRLQEMYLPDGDLHSEGGGRQRRFRWSNMGTYRNLLVELVVCLSAKVYTQKQHCYMAGLVFTHLLNRISMDIWEKYI